MKWERANAVGDVEGVGCAEEKAALVVAVGALVKAGEIIGMCARGGLEKSRTGARPISLGAGDNVVFFTLVNRATLLSL